MKSNEEVADMAMSMADSFMDLMEKRGMNDAEMLSVVVAIAGRAIMSFPKDKAEYVRAHLSRYIGMAPLPEDYDDDAHS